MILAGDIGGTKVNLCLYSLDKRKLVPGHTATFVSKAHTRFSDIIDAFLKDIDTIDIKAACFGIAGPVIDGSCQTTNLPWQIVTEYELSEQLATPKVKLLNDLAATAYGMLFLDESELIELNPNAKDSEGNIAVIAAGTGLSEAILYFDGKQHHPMATEGGHSDFAPTDAFDADLLNWLRKRHPDHVSYERILCGEGIATLYDFIKENEEHQEPGSLKNLQAGEDKSARISQAALQDKAPLAQRAIKEFSKLYGAEAGNLALKSLSLGGVYIGGGIAPKILPALQDGVFLESFMAKGRYKGMLSGMSVKVSLNQQTALIGAAHFAKEIQ